MYDLPDSVKITYGTKNAGGIIIADHGDDFFQHKKSIDPQIAIRKNWNGTEIPFLFGPAGHKPFFKKEGNSTTVNYDIIASAFYFLSGWHEYYSEDRDEINRFPYQASIQQALDIATLPVVNYYFDILKEAVETHYNLKLESYPHLPFKFNLALTHDVDKLKSGWKEEGWAAVQNFKLFHLLQIVLQKISGRDPWTNLDELLAFTNTHGIQSSYYFLPEQRNIHGIDHADYDLGSREVQQIIHKIISIGAETGIHGPYGSHLNSKKLLRYIKKIGGKTTGGRFHYLCYDPKNTPQVLHESGLSYDSTLGFQEQIGFRNSIAHPFYLYDLRNDRPTSVLEIPLVIMDQTLAHQKYMNVSPEMALSHIHPVLEEIKKFKGGAALLWHNNFFSKVKYQGWKQVLNQTVNYCKKQDARIGTALSLYEDYK